ncbi:DNA circularization N-terminal domain-containing protein [Rhodoplanes sp. TEM]|uniref:DNA circularization N-terminal domain-containing protein n=1 Tax=Rhodoplanes tepidamans TaxID=200616 RepID=A0ABT5JEB7_RHOTP|nr:MULTISPECIES: DNA circularization N-terminal domain-containing protein [Rhodoplanes]MDC7787961.1 DNA circularization N-terminal domain-containing protein [Rhodoplanes tepidamans]MDC7984801.1 DNA circularization N-terminal domain-containing protein [Rhodoplanes sp. TEM]MDQ0358390.1 prophage DNA circulation protein [Rhodoplanes tepidamans]
MSLLDTALDEMLPGLLPGAFRGVRFWVPDARHEAGRRTIRTLFPGLDDVAIDDLGIHRGVVDVVGVIVGDDYVARAEALRVACQTPGPGILLHPWLGEMRVTVAEAASISFAARELRVARFRVGFFPTPEPSIVSSTLSAVLGAVSGLLAAAAVPIATVTGAAMLPVALWSAARGVAREVATLVSTAAGAQRGAASLTAVLVRPLAGLDAAVQAAAGRDSAASLAAALTALTVPVATLAIGAPVAAIGSAVAETVDAETFGARDGAGMLLGLVDAVLGLEATSRPEQAVRLGASAAIASQAARVITEIDHESRQEAARWRSRLFAAIDAVEAAAVPLAADGPEAVAGLTAALGALRASVARDINEAIGRLPAVVLVTPAATLSAWLVADHLAGDEPGAVVPMLDDIVTRNGLRHPGLVPPEPIEVLTEAPAS